jgi:hypothetical protein
MENDGKEITIGIKANSYKNLFFDNKNSHTIVETPIEKKVIDKNKCKRNLLLVTALSVGYVLLSNYHYEYNEQKNYY